jgi:hypothetical protein
MNFVFSPLNLATDSVVDEYERKRTRAEDTVAEEIVSPTNA